MFVSENALHMIAVGVDGLAGMVERNVIHTKGGKWLLLLRLIWVV